MTTGTGKFEVENRCKEVLAPLGFFQGVAPATMLAWIVVDPEGATWGSHRDPRSAEAHAAKLNEMFN